MKLLTPIELLKKEHEDYKRALAKAEEMYFTQKIDINTLAINRQNLEPAILSYKEAIQLLEKYERNNRTQSNNKA